MPFVSAKEMMYTIPTTIDAKRDSFIDDFIRIFLNIEENCKKQLLVVPLAIYLLSWPHNGNNKTLSSKQIISESKFEAEGTPPEIMIMLGWLINTSLLLIQLPEDKYLAWKNNLINIIKNKRVTSKNLQSIEGRLTHASYVISLSCHFLNDMHTGLRLPLHKSNI